MPQVPVATLQAAEAAALAIGALDVLVARSPLRLAWLRRTLLREAVRQARVLGHEVGEFDTAAALAGVRGSARRDGGGVAEALRRLDTLSRLQLACEERPGKLPKDLARLPLTEHLPTLVAAAAAAVDLSLDESLRLPATLQATGVTATVLPCLTGAGGRGTVDAMLHDLRAEARHGVQAFVSLRDTWRDWQRRLGPRRSTSRLPYLVDFAIGASFVTSQQVRDRLGITQRGASLLLGELVDLGILVKHPGRGHLDLYLAPDLSAPSPEEPADQRHTERLRPHDAEFARLAEEDLVPVETDLGDLLRDLDAVNDRIKQVLAAVEGRTA